jgi:ubiquitin C-terminal hydrolase
MESVLERKYINIRLSCNETFSYRRDVKNFVQAIINTLEDDLEGNLAHS